ncbi:MAG: hypothetical protein COA79_03590 [Planctomycetota bacterium]|nr:MAG: hypothetical protein COA79_03590 [Planctomycetota bacterium]
MKILIVDDEEVFTEYLSLHLSFNHHVKSFNDPVDALRHYEDNQDYDVIIVDFYMPKIQGNIFVDRVCEIKVFQNIIVSSGAANYSDLKFIKKYNNSIKIISKPFDLSELDEVLNFFKEKQIS